MLLIPALPSASDQIAVAESSITSTNMHHCMVSQGAYDCYDLGTHLVEGKYL